MKDACKIMRTKRGNGFSFGMAIAAMKLGSKVHRRGWNGKNMWLGITNPDKHTLMTQPYIYMCIVGGGMIPWLASQTDMLAEDYELVV